MTIATSFAELSPIQFAIVLTLAALLAMAVFAHASRHGSRHATAWGLATFLFAGIVVPVYFVRYWLRRR
jgi:Zn-dependent protease